MQPDYNDGNENHAITCGMCCCGCCWGCCGVWHNMSSGWCCGGIYKWSKLTPRAGRTVMLKTLNGDTLHFDNWHSSGNLVEAVRKLVLGRDNIELLLGGIALPAGSTGRDLCRYGNACSPFWCDAGPLELVVISSLVTRESQV